MSGPTKVVKVATLLAIMSATPVLAQSADSRSVAADSADKLPVNSIVRVVVAPLGPDWRVGQVRQITAGGCVMIHIDTPDGGILVDLANIRAGQVEDTLPSGQVVWRPVRKGNFPAKGSGGCESIY